MIIYDSFTKSKTKFVPIHENKIKMYVCGITVYDLCHVGHGRTFTSFDVIYRYLLFKGYDITYVRNITDIDDKIIKKALELNIDIRELTESMILEMNKDFKKLNLLKPNIEPKATESIKEIIELCEKLEKNDVAYVNKDGDLLFSVDKFKEYGKLSKQNINQLISGQRKILEQDKKSTLDFVLWKSSKNDDKYCWDSPWGKGRPGWHIECSAMSYKTLGSHFDIHGGGSDLIFPHHENEIAQSCCAHNTDKYSNYWLHSGMININHEKMSKSLNNFFTLREVLNEYHPETVRYFFITSHYRSTLDYSDENLNIAHSSLTKLYKSIEGYQKIDLTDNDETNNFVKLFIEVMDDDFNTPKALSILFELSHKVNHYKNNNQIYEFNLYASRLVQLSNILGILLHECEEFLSYYISEELSHQVEKLILMRKIARDNKNWIEADNIRKQLDDMNIIVEDNNGSTKWSLKK